MQIESKLPPALSTGSFNKQIGYEEASNAIFKNTNWWTVFSVFDLQDFNPSPLWISKKTGLSVEEVVEATEGLVSLGFLEKKCNPYEPIKDKQFINLNFEKKNNAEIVNQHILISQQILNHINPEATVKFQSNSFATNNQIMTELLSDIQSAINKAFTKSQTDKSKNDCIYHLTFTGVNVLKTR